MKQQIQIAIVGRRNVGKSTLFNAIARQKKAIVADIPGVTRDFILFELNGVTFLDTPGLDFLFRDLDKKEEILDKEILNRTRDILSRVNMVIFLVSYPDVFPFDLDFSKLLRKENKPVILVVNKVDSLSYLQNLGDYYQFGFPEMVPISAKNRWNVDLLKEKVKFFLKEEFNNSWDFEIDPKERFKKSKLDQRIPAISIVGRPNSGKSTLLNKITGRDLALVSDIPGTTRDSIDTELVYHGKKIKIIDTAGIRKQGKRNRNRRSIERFSFLRTENAIKSSHAVLHLIDATSGITDTDKKIFDIAVNLGKQILVIINKWDLVAGKEKNIDKFWKDQVGRFPLLAEVAFISVSALTGIRVGKVLSLVLELIEKAGVHIKTAELNNALMKIMGNRRIVSTGGRFKIFYITQVDIYPPTFVLFVNHPDLIKKNAIKFIERNLKESLNFEKCLVRIKFRGRKD